MRRYALLFPLVLVAAPAVADPIQLPPRKPGQWEMNVQVDTAAMPPQVIRMCLDAESDKLLNERFGGLASTMCSKQEQKKDGDDIVIDSECKVGNMATSSHTVVSGDFNSEYKMQTDVKMSGSNAPGGLKDQTGGMDGAMSQQTTITAKRVGDCAAGFKPGDIDLGSGKTVNVRDMPKPEIQ